MFAHLKALEWYARRAEGPPVNVICLFEGEEEIGSEQLLRFVRTRGDELRADVAVVSDTPMLRRDQPAIMYSMRGDLYVDLEVTGPAHELHSGRFGGVVRNPLAVLGKLLGELHDDDGRVAIEGFYDHVRDVSPSERAFMRCAGPADEDILRETGGVPAGERGYSLYERQTVRPSLEIAGLAGGYAGSGVRGVVPARAVAKLDFRLVPDQTPETVEILFRRYLEQHLPPGVRATLRRRMRAEPVALDRSDPYVRMAARAYEVGFGRSPVLLRGGGSLPVVASFQRELGLPTVLMGFALLEDRPHAPDESFAIERLLAGAVTSAAFMDGVARAAGSIRARGQTS
jgi:acetylornithine deacetylase/succinyl-diaminopimelate desuccinylase-like protein